MNELSITLRSFPSHMSTAKRIALAAQTGFSGVEVNLEPSEEFTLESDSQELTRLRRLAEDAGLRVSSVYSREQWRYPITSQDRARRRTGKDLLERLVKAAPQLGADTVLVVPGAVDNSLFVSPPEYVRYDLAYAAALDVLRELGNGICAKSQVHLAIENVWNKFLLSPLEMAQFVDSIGSAWVGVYFDVGNVLRTGFPEHWLSILGSRVKCVHFKDFRLAADNATGFVGLLEGDVNWPAVCAALKEIDYKGWVTAEVLPAYQYHGNQLISSTYSSMKAILELP